MANVLPFLNYEKKKFHSVQPNTLEGTLNAKLRVFFFSSIQWEAIECSLSKRLLLPKLHFQMTYFIAVEDKLELCMRAC